MRRPPHDLSHDTLGKAIMLQSPRLTWLPHRTPFSERFGDIYQSREGGLAETRHVFLDGCGLPSAWRDARSFVIGETGFGTGLNFLSTWDLWRKTKRADGRLHYIAVEGFPLSHDELRECVERWPELRQVGQGLLRAYLHPQAGYQRLFLDGGRVVLTLLFGEVLEMLSALEAHVDAWFLDGFAPEKNPEMWRPEVMAELARLSRPGARLATYSAAGDVRRGLAGVGFDVVKTPGFAPKREMLRATFRGHETSERLQPWFARAPVGLTRGGHAAIIGTGLAGTHAAVALQRRGWKTTLIDRHAAVAEEASGNSVGVLMPRLTAAPNLDGRIYAAAWRMMLDHLETYADAGIAIGRDRCGVLQLAVHSQDDERQAAIAAAGTVPEPLLFRVGASEASDIAGQTIPHGALYFPQGGWLNPKLLCEAAAKTSRMALGATAASVRRTGGVWEVLDEAGACIASADIVVFAGGMHTVAIPQLSWLPLAARRGQITFVAASARSAPLRSVLGYGGYLTPAHRGRHCLGATFDWTDDAFGAQAVQDDDHERNFADLAATLPSLAQTLTSTAVDGRAAIRCTTPDHLPVVGPVPDQAAYLKDFAELRHGHAWARYPRATYQSGLYVLAGLGSRGLVSAPLAAEILACHVSGEPWPVERDLVTALHPGRFLVRDLKRLNV
ncbi:MAG: bifunctional tRNA (5-methylaminomethyl-2-thiouridine)(34)-methyltransferase MnmD/FAD-dependent 5-carboxymethylaminomethyl-2-thiouridine(34) oxidoreductase MnmC [Rhodospirillaceae bacterium]|nr:bifunctional tRNA (5-methylaminomethyl-2-thiouridine)(34)-methyltransferase MnmD/FAD-dependent 5-carboxymethylaminomethyl-2-thiouridine(34) oxidoreductase MnmC [Rhodospirillaceae bacterium]